MPRRRGVGSPQPVITGSVLGERPGQWRIRTRAAALLAVKFFTFAPRIDRFATAQLGASDDQESQLQRTAEPSKLCSRQLVNRCRSELVFFHVEVLAGRWNLERTTSRSRKKEPPVERGSITMNNERTLQVKPCRMPVIRTAPNAQDADTCFRTGIAIMFLKFSSLTPARC